MEPKPRGWARAYAEWFDDRSVVENYQYRPAYPPELFTFLAALAGSSGAVLDAGCGPGDLARPLAPLVGRVDAVDLSPRMIAEGRGREGGEASNLEWLAGAIEEVELRGPYDLVLAGDSVHWFDWPVAMPRLRDELAPGGHLAIVVRRWFESAAIWERLLPIYGRFGANPDFRPLDPIVELENRGLFARQGEHATDPSAWRPTIGEILGCLHSQNGFDPERMGADAVAAFDTEIEDAFQRLVESGVVAEHDGRFELGMRAVVVWGTPGS
jgi:SAM-dependent methyltransferase